MPSKNENERERCRLDLSHREPSNEWGGIPLAPPLAGISVLDITQLLPGGFCSMILGDLGAEVLKVEPPCVGEPLRSIPPMVNREGAYFLSLNRNKRSMTLNLKSREGKDIFMKLVERHDVLLESFRAGTTARLGIDYESVKVVNPGLVYCSLTGYGQNGPYADRSSHDIDFQALSGILSITGPKRGDPVLPGIQLADVSGSLFAVVGILSALMARASGGLGRHVDISMLDGSLALIGLHMMKYFVDGIIPGPESMLTNGVLPCYRIYRTKDGGWMALGALEPKFWQRFCTIVGREDLIERQYDMEGERRDETVREVGEIFLRRTRDEWVEMLRDRDICCEPVKNFREALEDPHILSRDMILESRHPTEGEIRQIGFPIKMTGSPCLMRRHAPSLGEHNMEVLESLGYGNEEMDRMKGEGII